MSERTTWVGGFNVFIQYLCISKDGGTDGRTDGRTHLDADEDEVNEDPGVGREAVHPELRVRRHVEHRPDDDRRQRQRRSPRGQLAPQEHPVQPRHLVVKV